MGRRLRPYSRAFRLEKACIAQVTINIYIVIADQLEVQYLLNMYHGH